MAASFYPEVMSRPMQRVLAAVASPLRASGFYLAGGTAVALYYGHRRSVDLDWFRETPFDPLTLKAQLRECGVVLDAPQIAENTLIGRIGRVKLSLFAYAYPLVAPLQEWSDYGAPLASREDLLCMKLAAIQQRGVKRDFIDLYMLLQEIPIEQALSLYQRKYGMDAGASLAYALCYFEDADSDATPRLRIRLTWREVKRFMLRTAEQITGI
ncbi:MAG: nucleotidyl transferase AbiEii/AbiGii toxin family protein [Fimbriimonadales bacterium]|nr:nucleotidyl transferase AbiEii/AbiGii toxin family protein [Fimbriimonadales bacterium]